MLQPSSGSPGPPSARPTLWAPERSSGAGLGGVELRPGRHRHQEGHGHADEGDQHAQAQAPGEDRVGQALADQQDGQQQGADRHRGDEAAHQAEDDRIEGCADVEMARRAAQNLHDDQCGLHQQAQPGDTGGQLDQPRVASNEGQQPDKGGAKDGDGDGELERLDPGRHAGDDAWVGQERDDEHRDEQQVGQPSQRQQRAECQARRRRSWLNGWCGKR